ncbi:hypothetical protein [Dipodfec virus RodF1_24]|uniref:Uncharacterized protein n=1 Tax=Dipodfec virus RodF1_24 TaxID=2929294 RepID=A0A976N2S9_9VIRU|nr:hypothetical protein [Dipodfec virus RodF1_24]
MKTKIITVLTLIAAICSAIIGVLTSSCTSYLITTKSATDTDVSITTTNKVDSVSVGVRFPNMP